MIITPDNKVYVEILVMLLVAIAASGLILRFEER